MRTYKLYLIRHGITDANRDGRYLGLTDLPLNAEGEREILSLISECEYPKVQKAYSSPLRRAIETAKLIYPQSFIETVDDLKEYSFGVFENKSIDELSNNSEYESWVDGHMRQPPKSGEDKKTFINRLFKGFSYVILDMMKNQIHEAALVSHGGVLSAILYMFGIPKRSPLAWATKPGRGYAVMTTTQMWARDNMFEICDPIPYNQQVLKKQQYFNLNYNPK